jgi:hypothetical protein
MKKKLRSYDKERDIKVYRADDCIDRYGDCDGTGSNQLHGYVTVLNIERKQRK